MAKKNTGNKDKLEKGRTIPKPRNNSQQNNSSGQNNSSKQKKG